MRGVLSRHEILSGIKSVPPLVEEYLDLSLQLQVNGFDLTLRSVSSFASTGQLAFDNRERILPNLEVLSFDDGGAIELAPGSYSVIFNEIVNLPKDVMALGRPRSSLLRCGASLHTAVWDAGYSGRSESLLVVYNGNGITLKRDARIMQLVFLHLTRETDGYSGIYQNENTV